jgi:hypothetical protein
VFGRKEVTQDANVFSRNEVGRGVTIEVKRVSVVRRVLEV